MHKKVNGHVMYQLLNTMHQIFKLKLKVELLNLNLVKKLNVKIKFPIRDI